MQNIVDKVKELTGNDVDYPSKEFTSGFAPYPDPSILLEQEDQNKAGERPGKQSKQRLQAVDDLYANGKPYVGSGKLEGKKAIISGGDSGIGRAIAILFAIEGADSTIAYLPSEQQDAEDVQRYIATKAPGRTVNLVALDLRTEANNIQLVQNHVSKFGKIDILVPNAAQQLENHDITTLDSKQWSETFDINIHHVSAREVGMLGRARWTDSHLFCRPSTSGSPRLPSLTWLAALPSSPWPASTRSLGDLTCSITPRRRVPSSRSRVA